MERQLPKNVRQIGNVSDNPKIYVEDYVDTYLNQLRKSERTAGWSDSGWRSAGTGRRKGCICVRSCTDARIIGKGW